MKKTVAFLMMAILLLTVPMFASAADAPIDVRIAIHANVGGAPLAGVAIEQGFFAEEGINPIVTIVESGPAEMAAMRADGRTLDCGFIGAGVAWNAMDPNGNQLKFIFLDNLSNSEGMVARKGVFVDTNANGFYDYDELYAGLKGRTIYIDTATTPGGWFKDLLNKIHTVLATPAAEQLWIYTETADYVKDYTAPNSDEAYKITVVQLANENLPAAMSTADASRVDIAVGFAPVPGIIVASNTDMELVAATDTHLPDKYFPSTWVASQKWIDENPDAVQRVVNALVKALNYRGDPANQAVSLAAGENLAQKPTGSFDASAAVWPTAEEYKEWFASADGKGYEYMNVLYGAKKGGVPEGSQAKPLEECMDFTFLLKTLGQ